MSEDNTLRGITIAISIFVFLFTVTVILLYYNSAVGVAKVALESNVDFGAEQEEIKYGGPYIWKGIEIVSHIKNMPKDIKLRLIFLIESKTKVIGPKSINNYTNEEFSIISPVNSYTIVITDQGTFTQIVISDPI